MKSRFKVNLILVTSIVGSSMAFAGSAKETWTTLVRPKLMRRAAFKFVENKPALPNVLIYGDSISIGYIEQVRRTLKGKANVYRIYCNGGDSKSLIPKMIKMHKVMRDKKVEGHWAFEWDVIYFNVGLHDLKYRLNKVLDKKNGTQEASLEVYEKNLRQIVEYLKKFAPKAKLIFATTTPVPEESAGRFAGDAAKFNEVALKVMKAFPEVTISDLYGFTKPNSLKWWIKPGNVHYNEEGRNAQGREVAGCLLKILEQKMEVDKKSTRNNK